MEEMAVFNYGYVVIHNVDLDKWCNKWELEVFDAPCTKCGNMLTANVPIAAKNRRGLAAKPCCCGNKNTPFSFIDFDFTAADFDQIVGSIKGWEDDR